MTVHDFSSNGTFINGTRIGKGKSAILRDGNELGLGSWGGHTNISPIDDFRYIFRLTAQGPPRDGLYAHYDIGHELGKGSFATVVSAVSRDNGLKYAVKMINKARFRNHSNSDQMGMFLREIAILEKLKHPNICLLKEVFTDNNNISKRSQLDCESFISHFSGLVLEFIEGGDLLEYIIKNGGLSESLTRFLTRQLCDALKVRLAELQGLASLLIGIVLLVHSLHGYCAPGLEAGECSAYYRQAAHPQGGRLWSCEGGG